MVGLQIWYLSSGQEPGNPEDERAPSRAVLHVHVCVCVCVCVEVTWEDTTSQKVTENWVDALKT